MHAMIRVVFEQYIWVVCTSKKVRERESCVFLCFFSQSLLVDIIFKQQTTLPSPVPQCVDNDNRLLYVLRSRDGTQTR